MIQGGIVRSRQGVNLPGVKLSVAAMSPADWQHAEWAAAAGADFVSLSFVRSPVEVNLLKELLRTRGSAARVVAKIEKREAIENLEQIIETADAVMVARGDLGVEIDVASMPMVQKRIIRVCQQFQKPVIVATQMLDSMHHSRRPTRAETTDVANAILDGADACMLSGETAIGEHPRQVVEMMRRIALATEQQYLESRRQYLGELLGRGRSGVSAGEFLPQPEQLVDGLNVGGESTKADEEAVVHLEHLAEVTCHGLGLDAETGIGGDGDTVLAGHRNYCGAIIFENGHPGTLFTGRDGVRIVGSAVQQDKARHVGGATKNEAHGERWRDGKMGDCQKERGNWLHGINKFGTAEPPVGTGTTIDGKYTVYLDLPVDLARSTSRNPRVRVCIYFFFLPFPFALRSSPAFLSFSFKAF